MKTTPEQRAEWARLAEKATPGEWLAERCTTSEVEVGAETTAGHLSVAWVHLGHAPSANDIAGGTRDAAFIAAARTAVPALLADLEAAERREEGLRRKVLTLAHGWQTCDAVEMEDGEVVGPSHAVAKALRHCADGVLDALVDGRPR